MSVQVTKGNCSFQIKETIQRFNNYIIFMFSNYLLYSGVESIKTLGTEISGILN